MLKLVGYDVVANYRSATNRRTAPICIYRFLIRGTFLSCWITLLLIIFPPYDLLDIGSKHASKLKSFVNSRCFCHMRTTISIVPRRAACYETLCSSMLPFTTVQTILNTNRKQKTYLLLATQTNQSLDIKAGQAYRN